MKDKDQNQNEELETVGRRSLLTNMSVAAVAGLAASVASVPVQAQGRAAGFEPARHVKDAWMGELAGNHRVFVDSANLSGGANAVRYAKNIIAAHEDDYEGESSDYALIVCFRHGSTPYGFNDAVWEKYGALFNPNADSAPTANPMNTASFSNGQTSLADLRAKGVEVVICSRATRTYSRRLATATGASYDDVHAELVAGIIPKSRFVPAGVLAATRSQEYGYSLLYAQ
ncbi:MAG: hypothetical protein COA96_18160 [SAR86 cluster bacterium]|uniref:Uncharacterized protein n=1 Tax=SAR86 cluster bacterium TaxID=2030880 RepID=A0A2A5AC53_9GAMM|nr:MAG: hypothetical protein COA96_18160 [SAR86 cluster bacterium]